jgi:hypothetical protein
LAVTLPEPLAFTVTVVAALMVIVNMSPLAEMEPPGDKAHKLLLQNSRAINANKEMNLLLVNTDFKIVKNFFMVLLLLVFIVGSLLLIFLPDF